LSLGVLLHSPLLNCIFLSESMADPVPFTSAHLFSYFLYEIYTCKITKPMPRNPRN
jgi:hypothetical protein